jgi:predicted flap endonuclease-1-like 5' DNA nuclease
MAWTQPFESAAVEDRAERALRWPVGAVSPLWAVFGAAASAGVAWWWLTRWTQAANIEALAGFMAGRVKESGEVAADSELRIEEAVEEVDVAADVAAAGTAPAVIEAEPVPEPEPTPVAEPAAADDLTRMAGIGPKLSAALAERGVTRFAEIAGWTADDLAAFDAALSLKGRAVREAWVAQAKRLAKG